ncbi:MAG TPA: DUF1697 domain-containing protein [Candidatus Acidoferrum sp.]|nr:DUF1697 domain-containing protein [Candidatus Acidoferrum sp.]
MSVVILLLRAVNVGGHAVIKMADLRSLFESLKFRDTQTYVQSGKAVFRADEKDLEKLAKRIQGAIAKKFGFAPGVVLRTTAEMRDVIARCPFAKRKGIEPNKLHVSFLDTRLQEHACEQLCALPVKPEELIPGSAELFLYFPNGAGKSRLPWAKVDRICGTRGTARNWNTVTKLLAMAEALESAESTKKRP